ncbi:phosphopantothenoylcysteine synthetase/decarboxylase [Flavobacterium arsenatis]|uniref:Phosphopantothenoylcysteine synthetase/decarboxylase n=1 Tax=Flavobacterium arsenatis TaxID=1484332 RepID=A0ABU1TUB0_9FLAO|nr:hypothetical protein [Flavobacterium arsenatis]MDR6969469.1 phosphopantothenoylcysteine synthetase/decarboxylase [Flavobacterium arsenatis]
MRQLTVTIPDDFYNTFIAFFKQMPDVKIDEKDENEVPLWQQEMVLERLKNAKPEDYRSWEEVKKDLDEKWNFNG